MPTYEALSHFWRDYNQLTPSERRAFRQAIDRLIHDLDHGQFRPGLRVKALQGHRGIYEMTWAPDGRATFEFGQGVRQGRAHIIWRRIGGHDIFEQP